MTDPIREQLIGYLLGADEPSEHALVKEHLERDESLRRDLEVLRRGIDPLAADQADHQPPTGLAQRCCEYVFSRTEVMPAALSATRNTKVVRNRWSWLELSVAGAIAAAVAVFLLPKVYQSQVQSKLLACQNNLKDIGLAAAKYSTQNGYYPVAKPGDRVNAAGMWAPTLISQNYLQPGKEVVCPSSSLAEDPQFREPTLDEVKAMSEAQLANALPRLSSYGFTLGYRNDGQGPYKLQKNQNREHFAVAADSPGKNGTNSSNHGGNGQNVLFDDGHVGFVKSSQASPDDDDIFSNAHHEVAPGLNPNDSVIVPSQVRPE
jgi:type II secretory pathway pseudopilin PulG